MKVLTIFLPNFSTFLSIFVIFASLAINFQSESDRNYFSTIPVPSVLLEIDDNLCLMH